MRASALLLVPFEPGSAHACDPTLRRTLGAHLDLPLRQALCELESQLGFRFDSAPVFAGSPLTRGPHRSLTGIALATALDHAGIDCCVLDPGPCELHEWRKLLRASARDAPALVGVSSTFITSRPWLEALLGEVRAAFPSSVLALGGYYYTTDTEGFLSLDADVLCVGEGEVRLPEIARRVASGAPLDDIPGLYLRQADGSLKSTGRAEPLDLAGLVPPDWSFASRVRPPVDPRELDYVGLETQRGCAFMCAFCTYRTLASPTRLPPALAAERILALGGKHYVELYDATATSPRARWQQLCARLAAAQGAELAVGAFARVSDLDAASAALMGRAGVRHVYIGQESGDQALLNAMRKGTKLAQVLPAIHALGSHGISVTFGLIHGFPGESASSLAATRALLGEVNASRPDAPTVFSYDLTPFSLQDFAAVSTDETLRADHHHFLGYRSGGFTVPRICEEILRTIVHTGRCSHAPVAQLAFQRALALPTSRIATSRARPAIFRWAKALERGVGIFLERLLDGTRPDPRELDEVARRVLAPYDVRRRPLATLSSRVEASVVARLRREWSAEQDAGVGPLTRALVASLRRRAPSPTIPRARAHAQALLSTTDRRYVPAGELGRQR